MSTVGALLLSLFICVCFQIYLHPIPPVLDVTRKMVIRYNELYKDAVRGLKGTLTCGAFGVMSTPHLSTGTNSIW